MSAQRGNNIDARKLQLALYAISNLYVDSTSETKLVEDAIVGMLEKLYLYGPGRDERDDGTVAR